MGFPLFIFFHVSPFYVIVSIHMHSSTSYALVRIDFGDKLLILLNELVFEVRGNTSEESISTINNRNLVVYYFLNSISYVFSYAFINSFSVQIPEYGCSILQIFLPKKMRKTFCTGTFFLVKHYFPESKTN